MRGSFCIVAALTQLIGCASIVNGTNQSISVETVDDSGAIKGASCRLSNNKGTWFLTSPGTATVHRSFEDLTVRCEKDALDPGSFEAKSSTKGMAFGNILFGGFIGAGVDIGTGAAYDYPELITVAMGKSGSNATSAPAAPASAASASASPASAATAAAPAPDTAASASTAGQPAAGPAR